MRQTPLALPNVPIKKVYHKLSTLLPTKKETVVLSTPTTWVSIKTDLNKYHMCTYKEKIKQLCNSEKMCMFQINHFSSLYQIGEAFD